MNKILLFLKTLWQNWKHRDEIKEEKLKKEREHRRETDPLYVMCSAILDDAGVFLLSHRMKNGDTVVMYKANDDTIHFDTTSEPIILIDPDAKMKSI